MDEVAVKGLHRIEVRDSNGDSDEAVPETWYRKSRVPPPIGRQKPIPRSLLTAIYAKERGIARNRKKDPLEDRSPTCPVVRAPTSLRVRIAML